MSRKKEHPKDCIDATLALIASDGAFAGAIALKNPQPISAAGKSHAR